MAYTALITGCSTGIGRELAKQLHHKGWHVFVSARKIEALKEFENQAKFTVVALDVNDAAQRESLFAQLTQHGRLDLLVNNAGYGAMGPMIEMPETELKQQFATNVFAPLALAQLCFPLLRQSSKATIVNLGSVSGILTTPFSGAYCATKAALHSISDALRMELAPFGIQVITIQPGAIESEFGNNATQSLLATLPENSVYQPLKPFIEARANASQQNSTSTAAFVKQMVAAIEEANPKAETRIGSGSTALPLLRRLLPLKVLDRILKKRFGLDKTL